MKIFMACPRSMDTKMSHVLQEELRELFHDGVEFFSAAVEFEKHFASIGSWDGWAEYVACGQNYLSRQDNYDGIMCLSEEVGKSTAQIVKHCLDRKKAVCIYVPNRTVEVVHSIETVDAENWASGWRLLWK
jgi:hypothetical protein